MSKSKVLVGIQLLSILLMISIYGWKANGLFFAVQLFSIALAIWAFIQFRKKTFSIYPDLKENSNLIKTGPYKWVKNPMYLSLLLYFGVFLVQESNWIGLLSYFSMFIVLFIKIRIEEKALLEQFPLEREYIRKTKRLIPLLY